MADESMAGEPLMTQGDGAPAHQRAEPQYTEGKHYFIGFSMRTCRDHRTTGGRAWCFDCSEWCYPTMPCVGCARQWIKDRITDLPEQNATSGRDFGRGYAKAVKDVLDILEETL